MWLVGLWRDCCGDECEASIYGKIYTEGSDPFDLRRKYDILRIESMMKMVEGMNVAARRLAKGVVSSANPSIYSKTYMEGSDPFEL